MSRRAVLGADAEIDAEAIVIPLASDADILADLRAGSARRLLEKILDGFRCRHRWDLVIPHPSAWSQWDFVSYRTQMPDLGVFRRRIANTIQCSKCGVEVDTSDWDDVVRFVEIGRRYYWTSKVYFELLVQDANKHDA